MTFYPTLDDKTLKENVDLVKKLGSIKEAAKKLGIAHSSLVHRLALASRRGFNGASVAGPLPPGMYLNETSTYYNKDGELIGQWVKAKGFIPHADILREVKEGLKGLKALKLPPAPKFVETNFLTVYPLADLHLGMYAWDEETGNNYDVEIARKLALEVIGHLVRRSEPSAEGVLLNLGDFFHSDSDENRTRRSGNALDVDTRYGRVLRLGVQVAAQSVLLLLEKHRHVTVRNIPGNHDPYGALALAVALSETFRDDKRVTIDLNPGPFWAFQFGKVMLTAAHGDMAQPMQMPPIMAAKYPQMWGETTFRYALMGHRHSTWKKPSGERGAMQVEVFQTLAPRDAWGNAKGFVAGRSMSAITYSRDEGEKFRVTENIGGPR